MSKDKKIDIGITLGAIALGAGIGLLAFDASKEQVVNYYGVVMIDDTETEETNELEENTEILEYDPEMEEIICDYGIPSVDWNN